MRVQSVLRPDALAVLVQYVLALRHTYPRPVRSYKVSQSSTACGAVCVDKVKGPTGSELGWPLRRGGAFAVFKWPRAGT
jgi:hypothetical protein